MGGLRLASLLLLLAIAGGPAARAEARAEMVNARASYPEGPLWRGGALYYTEMSADRVSRWDPAGSRSFWEHQGCGPTSLAALAGGRFLVLCHLAGSLAILDRDGRLLQTLERDSAGRRLERPNDSTGDGRGGAYLTDAGVFRSSAPATGRVYHLSAAGDLREVAGGLRYANGITLLRGRRLLFVSEHLARRVWVYPVSADAGLGARRLFFDLATVAEEPAVRDEYAGPDGLELDASGNLYVCEYGAGRLLVVSPAGQLVRILPVALPYVTNAAFDDDQATLFVTGAWTNRAPTNFGQVLGLPGPGR